MSLLSTSPGVRGSFSLPSFNDNFDTEKGIISNTELDEQLLKIIDSIEI